MSELKNIYNLKVIIGEKELITMWQNTIDYLVYIESEYFGTVSSKCNIFVEKLILCICLFTLEIVRMIRQQFGCIYAKLTNTFLIKLNIFWRY